MSPLTHSLATLWLRFRWEILGFLLLAIASAVADLLDSSGSGILASLKSLGFFWLTLRIALSETGFKTHGGWETLTFNSRSVLIAQLLLLLILAIVMLGIRVFVLHLQFHQTGEQWIAVLRSSLTAEVLPWLVFLICLKGFAYLLLRPLEGKARKAAWAAMVIVLVPCTFLVAAAGKGRNSSSGGSRHPETLSLGIQRQLPEATEFVGTWQEYLSHAEVPSSRILVRIPLDEPESQISPGLRISKLNSSTANHRQHVRLELLALDPALFARLTTATPVLAYRGGYYGSSMSYHLDESPSRALLTHTPSLTYQLSFASPRCFPEFQNTDPADFAPTELLFFVPTEPYLPATLDFLSEMNREATLDPPLGIPPPATGLPFTDAVRELIDSQATRKSGPEKTFVQALIGSLPAEAIHPILDYHPWPDHAWERVVLPVLTKHAEPSHRPALLARLALDPRLTTLFIEKGWSDDALPILRQLATECLPMNAVALTLLAEQNDPDLADELATLAIRLHRGIEKLAPILRNSPGFDWPAFVAEGWRSRKYGDYRYDREGWLYALWAAELGDRTALRRFAEEAARGKKWERKQLAKLIPSAPDDILPFLRQHFQELEYLPATKTWQLSL